MIGAAVRVPDIAPTVTINDSITVPLTEPVVIIGRDPGCGVVLDDITVSRRHAELRRDGDLVTLADLGSLNGTFVNRSPVETAVLHDGDAIWIGEHRMIFRSPRAAEISLPLARAS
jgi:pSer/pThr/pTyr-binding forkhead associated (FHA) protein